MIKYFLRKSKLNTSASSPFVAQTLQYAKVSLRKMIQEISRGTTVMAADTKAVLENMQEMILSNLAEGRTVDLGFLRIRPVVKGVFQHPDETFQKDKHRIEPTVTVSDSFKKELAMLSQAERIDAREIKPILMSLENLTGESNTSFSSGDLVKLRGSFLNFEKSNPELGVFVQSGDSTIPVGKYAHIGSKSVTFAVPEGLSSGSEVTISLRGQFNEELRTGILKEKILAD